MKKKSIFLAFLSSCIGLGIILIIIGILLGGHIYNLAIQPETQEKGVSTKLPDISLTDTKDIQNLDFKLSAASIKIRRGDIFQIEGKYLSKNEVKDGTWTVESKFSNHFTSISLFGTLHVPFPDLFSNKEKKKGEIIVTLPEYVNLEEINLELSASDVSIEKLSCRDIDLDISAGSITVDTLQAKEAFLDVSAGNIKLKRYQITDSISLDCSMGDIDFGSREYATENVCKDLEADCSMGDITVYGKLTGDSYLDCSMGNIKLNLVGSNENYKTNHTNSTLGDINYTTKNFLKKSGEHRISSSSDKSHFGTLDLSCTMGDIDICYLYSSTTEE